VDDVNPYQPPAVSWSRGDVPPDDRLRSALSCPHCHAEVTFWSSLKQINLFRYKCPQCRSKCKVRAPWLGLILLGMFGNGMLIVLASIAVFEITGSLADASVACAVLYIGGCSAVQLWWYRYFQQKGSLVALNAGEASETAEGASPAEH
jgi:hypothetical protein